MKQQKRKGIKKVKQAGKNKQEVGSSHVNFMSETPHYVRRLSRLRHYNRRLWRCAQTPNDALFIVHLHIKRGATILLLFSFFHTTKKNDVHLKMATKPATT